MSREHGRAIEIFYSYAREDEALRNELEKHLSVMKQRHLISDWHDRNISAGKEWSREIDMHLNTAHIILLLISSNFLASEYCSSIETKRAMERHETGAACVIPIILRPSDWKGTLFDNLQVLPTDGKAVTLWRNRDQAFLDIVNGIQKAVDEYRSPKATLRQLYCEALYESWKMLDFKGIMHVEMHRPLSMPLTEVFVFPDVLVGVPEYDETIDREEEHESRDTYGVKIERLQTEDEEQIAHEDIWLKREKRLILQRENLGLMLAKNRRLVILGDPGAGKSTLLHYLLLQLAQRRNDLSAAFPELDDVSSMVPLYIPLASYAEAWRSSHYGERSLKDFLPRYLRENYLEVYVGFIQHQLEQGTCFLLLDGLDHIPDSSLRIQIVRQIEAFTQSYPKNRYVITSRIVGYKKAQLAAEYQPYTLANFNEQQIRSFAQKWCASYERWVKGTRVNQYLQDLATREAERLFEATQRNPGVKRLATNPLLLTILALIQRQGIKLPSHRVELYKLCTTTLLDNWIEARGLSLPFSQNELIKTLRPLAFWMHEHPAVGAIPEEELSEQLIKQFLERNITQDRQEAARLAEQFLGTVQGQTGILVERGKQRYGFLHQTFEEYFAARELLVRKDQDRNSFIKKHLHHSRWREVLLLTVGIIGILQNNEEGVTELMREAIVKAESPFEKWLHRDLLFAGYCLIDEVGASIACENEIIEQIVYLYLTNPFDSLRQAFSDALNAWSGTRVATKAAKLVLPFFRKREILAGIVPVSSATEPYSGSPSLEKKISVYFQHLSDAEVSSGSLLNHAPDPSSQKATSSYKDRLNKTFTLRQIRLLSLLGAGQPQVQEALLEALSDADWSVRRAAAIALGQLGNGTDPVLEALLKALSDPAPEVREAATSALGQLGNGTDPVLEALLKALSDSEYESSVRQGAAIALAKLGSGQPHVLNALLSTFSDIKPYIRLAVATAIGQLDIGAPHVLEALLEALSNSSPSIRKAAAHALGQLSGGQSQVPDALLKALSDSAPDVRWAAAHALGHLGSGQPQVQEALLEALSDADWSVRRAAAIALGQLGDGTDPVLEALLKALSDSNSSVRGAAVTSLGQLGNRTPHVLEALLKSLLDSNSFVRQAIILALGQLGSGQPHIQEVLLGAFEDYGSDIRRAAAIALGQLDDGTPRILEALLKALSDSNSSVRGAAVTSLGQLGNRTPHVLDALLKSLSDPAPEVRGAVASALGQPGYGQPIVLEALLNVLSDSAWDVRKKAVLALGQMDSSALSVLDALIAALSDSSRPVRVAATNTLTILRKDRDIISKRIEMSLQQCEPKIDKQLKADDTVDSLVSALQQVTGEV